MKKTIRKWEIWGIIFIVLAGGTLHFLFELSGRWPPLAVIAAVNESVWEHLKLGFWPALIYFLIEYRPFKNTAPNLLFAKAMGILFIPIAITVLFYAYTAFTEDMLIIDLTIFVVAVIGGQLLSYRLLVADTLATWVNKLGMALLIFLTIAFSTLTYFAPHLPFFNDPVSGGYGI